MVCFEAARSPECLLTDVWGFLLVIFVVHWVSHFKVCGESLVMHHFVLKWARIVLLFTFLLS